jgi:hypothetical protein
MTLVDEFEAPAVAVQKYFHFECKQIEFHAHVHETKSTMSDQVSDKPSMVYSIRMATEPSTHSRFQIGSSNPAVIRIQGCPPHIRVQIRLPF